MENLKHFADQFKHLTLEELHNVDAILESEIGLRSVQPFSGGGDGDNDADDGTGALQDGPNDK